MAISTMFSGTALSRTRLSTAALFSTALSRLFACSSALVLLTACQPDTPSAASPDPAAATAVESPSAAATDNTVVVTLGTEATLTTLYSFPNGDNGQTLAQTIEHYLNQRIARDNIAGASVSVGVDPAGMYLATFTGSDPALAGYSSQIPQFLQNGQLAADAVTSLKAEGKWNEQEWRMFLPMGLALVNQRSVQLLHFPPDYSLPDQDYLGSKTSERWEQLLELNNVPAAQVTLYESILDVAPIAAPASAGSSLAETYAAFQPYVLAQLPLLLNLDRGAQQALPMVAYGGPVRSWVSTYYGVQDFGVNTLASIKITDTVSAPILGANHPSYIWYAKDQGRAAAMTVMQQDLVSACWQASMGSSPTQDGATVLANCNSYWQGQPMTVCVNMEIEAFGMTQAEAEAACQADLPAALQHLPAPEQSLGF